MKINTFKKRTSSMPLEGITLTKAEQRAASDLSRALEGVVDDYLATMRTALAMEILRLDDAYEWTEPGGENEQFRRTQQERAVIAWQAVHLAYIRSDARAETRAEDRS